MIHSKASTKIPRSLNRIDRNIRKTLEALDITETPNLAVCVQPKRQLWDLSSEKYKKYGYGKESDRIRVYSDIYFARSLGSLAAYYGTAHSLELRSHRFIFDEQATTYHREPFDVDHQTMPSKKN